MILKLFKFYNKVLKIYYDLKTFQVLKMSQICKKFCYYFCPASYTLKDFYEACETGNIKLYKQTSYKRSQNELEEACRIAVSHNQKQILELLLDSQNFSEPILTNLLKEACIKSFYDISELLAKKGANPFKGIAVAKSSNIISMLYKFKGLPSGLPSGPFKSE